MMSGKTMRAVRIHDWGVPPVVEEIELPQREDGQTLVRVEAAAVAHLDRTVAGGNFDLKPSLPYVGGVEGCGVVVESGTLPAGQRVILRGGGLGVVRDGTWAEYVAVRDRHLTTLPDGMAPELGATYFVPLTTAAVALRAVGRLGSWGVDGVGGARDEVVLIGGAAGAVGSMVAQLALREGATVIGVVADEDQFAALPPGVDPVLSGDTGRAAELAAERPATLLVDTLGGQGLAERSRWVRPGGRAVSIGYVTGTQLTVDLPNWLLDDVALLPVNMMRRDEEARAEAAALASLLVSGELTLNVERFSFDEAPRALEALGNGKLRGRGVLLPPEDVR